MSLTREDNDGSDQLTKEEHERLHRQGIYCMPEKPGLTKAAQDFLFESHETNHFVAATFALAKKMDATLDGMAPALELIGGDRDSLIKYQDAISPYKGLASDLLNSRTVDQFLNYLSDLFTTIYTTKPEMLKTKSEMKIEEILNHSNMDELIQSIAEKKVNDLAYLGFAKLVKTVKDDMGFDLISDSKDYEEMLLAIEFRNLFVHNHGIVNGIYQSRVPLNTVKIGDKLKPPGLDWLATIAFVVLDIDFRAISKFQLPPTAVPPLPRFCGVLGRV